MTGLRALVKRNIKMFFKDKGMFFTSLITPMILLVLYMTFLASVYKNSFTSAIPEGFAVDEALINGLVGGQLVSSLLAVCCITVAFCSNMLMVQDKVTGAVKDIIITPVRRPVVALSYYIATVFATLIICFLAAGAGLIYLSNVGWYLSVSDVLFILLDVVILVLFGTALSSVINFFLSTQGQISAVGTVVSAGYGFICGAYMPLSQFSEGIRNVISFLPCTYGTSLVRNHCMNGVFREMESQNFPAEVVETFRDVVDANIYLFEEKIEMSTMYLVVGTTVIACIVIYILMNIFLKRKAK